jgi:hypothetical protein
VRDELLQGTSVKVTGIPPQNTSRLKTRVLANHHHHKMRDKFRKSKAIDEAIAAIQRGDFVHYSNAATEYECDPGALSRRIRGLTKSRQ